MTVIGYARVSTADQTVQSQVDTLRAAGAERIVTETATGSNLARPVLKELLSTAERGDVIVVVAFDRISRSVHDLSTLLQRMDAAGLTFRSLREGVDTSTTMGRFTAQIATAFAELERATIAERTRAGVAAARRRGATVGRPPVLTDTLVDQVARMSDVDRLTNPEIQKLLKVSKSTVTRARRAARDRRHAQGSAA